MPIANRGNNELPAIVPAAVIKFLRFIALDPSAFFVHIVFSEMARLSMKEVAVKVVDYQVKQRVSNLLPVFYLGQSRPLYQAQGFLPALVNRKPSSG